MSSMLSVLTKCAMIILFCVLTGTGCAGIQAGRYGGGTSGTGLGYGEGPKSGVPTFYLRGQVRDAKGRPAAGVSVRLLNTGSDEVSVTDADGMFDLSAPLDGSGSLQFVFSAPGVEAQQTVRAIPSTVQEAFLYFRINGPKSISLEKREIFQEK